MDINSLYRSYLEARIRLKAGQIVVPQNDSVEYLLALNLALDSESVMFVAEFSEAIKMGLDSNLKVLE